MSVNLHQIIEEFDDKYFCAAGLVGLEHLEEGTNEVEVGEHLEVGLDFYQEGDVYQELQN